MSSANFISTFTNPVSVNFLNDHINHNNKKETLWYAGYYHLLSYIDHIENKSFLDYSNDGGLFFRILSGMKANIVSVDITKEQVTVSEEITSFKPVSYKVGSGVPYFLPEESYDYIFLIFSLSNISSSAEIRKILRFFYQALKKKGSLVLLNANWDKSNGKEFISFGLNYVKELSSGKKVSISIKTDPPERVDNYYWSKTDYIDFLTDTGFEIHAIKEPLVRQDNVKWLAERNSPPFHIIYAKKISISKFLKDEEY